MVHLGRMRDRSRKVLRICEICGLRRGVIRLQPLYQFEETEEKEGKIYGVWKKKGELQNTGKIDTEGLTEDYKEFLGKEFQE